MDCESFNKNLDNYEFLSEETKNEMNEHAQTCKNCRDEMDFMLSVMSTVKSLPEIEPPADFMDKLNLRIDMEEKIKYSIPSRLFRNVRNNWKQYTAVAACFALVAVITSNGKKLVDNMTDDGSGVIQSETVVTNSGETPVESPKTIISDDNGFVVDNALVSSEQEENHPSETNRDKKSSDTGYNVSAKVSSNAAVSSSDKSHSESVNSNLASETSNGDLIIAPANSGSVSQDEAEPRNESALSENNPIGDYTIAPANLDADEATDYMAGRSMPEAQSDISDSDVKKEYSLAYSRNIADGRNYTRKPSDNGENRAIGKIKISADDVEMAINIILEYSYDVNGDLYSTDSANLSLLLSRLNKQGVSYTNYTPAYEGDITFRLVIS